ncbi:MAG: winged helix-turn-helix domain-containing protein [Novosphingobium sp.]|nr:winged helix-turn-helix domain-containing protein [Novosphingobium sp.]
MATKSFQIGRLTLRARRELVGPCGAVALGGRALDLLSTLAEAGGTLITKDELFAAVWDGSIVEENALQAQVSAARKALGDEARRLVTVHGRGYRLDLDLAVPLHEEDREQASIAVLPFDNLSGNAEHAYLADGLAEELISLLAQVSGLKVPARTSSFAYRGRAVDIRIIAAELGVATVLEGSVRVGGDRLRVAAQLIEAASGFHIWSDNFDRTLTDLLDLQDDLAGAIASALRHELGPRLRETHSSEAMRLVLQARAASQTMRAEGLREAVRFAREALELDPQFAKAWESLALTTFVMASWGFAPNEEVSQAREYAQRAIDLDPRQAGAHAIIGGIEATRGRFTEAVELLERAQALESYDAVVREHTALGALLPTGLTSRATTLMDESLELSPARAISLAIRASCALLAGDYAAARRFLDTALRVGQLTSRWLVDFVQSELALREGAMGDAAAAMSRLVERELAVPEGASVVRSVFAAYAEPAARAQASEAAARLLAQAERSGTIWGHFSNLGLFLGWQVRLGNLDAAFAVAGRIVEHWRETGQLATGSVTLTWAPDMAPFRRDPRFQDLVRDLDLFRFWHRHGPPDGHRLENDKLVVL